VELLSTAVRIAEATSGRLTEREVDIAENQLEVDKTEEMIRALAPQQRLALKACYLLLSRENRKISTGQAYQGYTEICTHERFRPLSQRRFSDLVSFLDLYGLINGQVLSRGRYGNTRTISWSLSKEVVRRFLEN